MSTDRRTVPVALSIAGSDSGGGAGIQADLKAFARIGVHGTTAITALTAQNTVGVRAVAAIAPEMIDAQIAAVAEDLGIDAIKVGMLGTAVTVDAVAAALADHVPAGVPLVVDPVMVAESGATLLDDDARAALIRRLLPRATVITPNLPEAQILAEDPSEDAEQLARALHRLGPRWVLITGGHREQATDVLFDGDQIITIPGVRHPGGAAHGSGCTHSSALAAGLASGLDVPAAARQARAVAGEAVRDGLRELGAGAGPVNVLGVGC